MSVFLFWMMSFGELVNGLTIFNMPKEKKQQVDILLSLNISPLTIAKTNVKDFIDTSVCAPIELLHN